MASAPAPISVNSKSTNIPHSVSHAAGLFGLPAAWQASVPHGLQNPHSFTPCGTQIIVWTGVFYVSSAVSGIMNKQIISDYSVLPVTLTMWHLVVSVAFDGKCWTRQLPQAAP